MPDLAAELKAIQESAAIFPFEGRAFLRITGTDATRWLNGMVTNNIKDLAPGEGNYNFLLNAQGRIQGDCTIYREPGEPPTFLLETDRSQLETIHQLLDKFIIMDDVELTPLLFGTTLAILGPEASSILSAVEPPLTANSIMNTLTEPLRLRSDDSTGTLITSHGSTSSPAFHLATVNSTDAFLQAAIKAGATRISSEAMEAHRILSATPKYGIDIRNTETAKDLPQETAQTHALHFNKGCYLGQEIVERIHSRGQVHRTFTQFTLTGDLPTVPAILEANGKPAGELTSAVDLGDRILALGYIRREALETHAPLTYPNGTAQPNPKKLSS